MVFENSMRYSVHSMKITDFMMLITLAAIWGASYLFFRVGAPVLGAIPFSTFRAVVAALALLGYLGVMRDLPNFRERWEQFLVIGLLNNVIPFILIATAVTRLNASLAAILNATTPLLTALIAAVWIKDPFGIRKVVGVLLGIIGVAVLTRLSPIEMTSERIVAVMLSLLASVSYGFAGVFARTRFKSVSPIHASVGQLCGSSLLLMPLLPFTFVPTPQAFEVNVVVSVLAISLICTSIAYLFYFRLIANIGATRALTVTFLVPFFSVAWSVLFLHEPLNVGMFIGLGVILFSVWLVLWDK